MAASFVTQINSEQGKELLTYLEEQGFTITRPPYTKFAATTKGISITYYQSGKLVVQGKEKDDFIRFKLEPDILQSLAYSHPISEVDTSPHIGVDEAGKGNFFGPLCIGAVYADTKMIEDLLSIGVKDSKDLQDTTIIKLAAEIKKRCPHQIIAIFPKKYNELYESFSNLNLLLAWGHSKAIESLVINTGCQDVLIDQFAAEHVVANAVKRQGLSVNLKQRHKGESDPVVAAASILARAAFVEGIDKLSEKYGLELPKGASKAVIRAGKQFLSKYTRDELSDVAKMHFKTLNEL